MDPELHPDVSVLSALLGTWEGTGTGEYPTIDDFAYLESITFTHVGKPFVAYTQRTRHPETGAADALRVRLLEGPEAGQHRDRHGAADRSRRDLRGGGRRRTTARS